MFKNVQSQGIASTLQTHGTSLIHEHLYLRNNDILIEHHLENLPQGRNSIEFLIPTHGATS